MNVSATRFAAPSVNSPIDTSRKAELRSAYKSASVVKTTVNAGPGVPESVNKKYNEYAGANPSASISTYIQTFVVKGALFYAVSDLAIDNKVSFFSQDGTAITK